MARDIEEFLRMAAQRRQEQKQRAAGKRPAAGPPAAASRPPVQRPSTPPGASSPPLRPGEEFRILAGKDLVPDMRDQSVSDHVRMHIDTSNLGEHARQLGGEVSLANDKLDARLHHKFDHSVASLRPAGSAHDTTTTTTQRHVSILANDLLDMLRTPQSIRQAVLIAEVLKRPDFDF